MTSKALFKSVSAMLVSLGCQIYANNRHFYSEASLLSLNYLANYMNIQKENNDKSTGYSCRGILVLSEYAKSLEIRVKETFSLWLNDRQFSQDFKITTGSLIFNFSQILRNEKKTIQFKLKYVD